MQTTYRTIATSGITELEIKKSRFICHLARVKSEDEAKRFIQEIKKEHWKATHNCSAFIIGGDQQIQRSSDDGEPSGTAGVPMLEVLKKNDLINVVAVVTRYFGGTKLGAGGLIRAYSSAVAHALEEIGIVEGRLQQDLRLTIQYPLLGKLQNFLELQQLPIKEISYTDQVIVCVPIDETALEEVQADIIDLLSGQVISTLGEKNYHEMRLTK